jgi:hypothetical protein
MQEEVRVDFLEEQRSLILDKRVIKYANRVKDLNRQYEMNNNCDLDNGVYNKFVNQSSEEDDDEDDGEGGADNDEEDDYGGQDSHLDAFKKQASTEQNVHMFEFNPHSLANELGSEEQNSLVTSMNANTNNLFSRKMPP